MTDEDYGYRLETAIVGGMLYWPKYIGEAASLLGPEDFENGPARTVFSAILELFFAGAPVDELSVTSKAGQEYQPFIEGCRAVGTPDVAYYCGLLRDHNRLRQAHGLGLRLAQAASLEEARDILGELMGLDCDAPDTEPTELTQLVADYVTRKQTGGPAPEYLPFGMEPLDKLLYVEPGDLVIVGGYSSAGKTLLSLQFALHMAERKRVGYFSLETSKKKLGERMISHYAQIGFADIKRGRESSSDLEKAVKMGMEVSERPGKLSIHRLRRVGVRDIRALTLRYRYEVIFIDYMQLLHAEARSRYEEITKVSMDLRDLSQAHGVTVVALAQLARPETVKGKAAPPGMWSLKESGQIENDADVVMLLYLSDDNDNLSPRVLKVGKNKDGERGEILLDFDGAHQTLSPMPPPMAEKYREIMEAAKKAAKARRTAETPEQIRLEEVPDEDIPF